MSQPLILQTILVNCISSVQKELYAIISTSYFVSLIVMYVGTSELHFCSPHWIQKYLNPKKLSACAKPPYLILPPYYPLPLFCPTPCMPSPYAVPPHAYPLLLLCPTPCMPSPLCYLTPCMHSPYSYPTHACPPPILSQPMHTLPPILS